MLIVCSNVTDKIAAKGVIIRTTTIVCHDVERVVFAFCALCGHANIGSVLTSTVQHVVHLCLDRDVCT